MHSETEYLSKEEIDRLWGESEKNFVVNSLKSGKKLSDIIPRIKNFESAFAEIPESLGCSDGRICEHRFGGAGVFILASAEEQEKFAEKNKGKIKEVTSHEGCGAAKIKFDAIKEAGEQLPVGVKTANELGIFYAKKMADILKAEYRHIKAEEMSGKLHNERAIYFDGTGKFNSGALSEMPAGFISSSPNFGFSEEYCRNELIALANIALGDHGFGEKFNKENPFYIFVSAENEEQLEKLKEIAQRAAENFNGRVAVDGFSRE